MYRRLFLESRDKVHLMSVGEEKWEKTFLLEMYLDHFPQSSQLESSSLPTV